MLIDRLIRHNPLSPGESPMLQNLPRLKSTSTVRALLNISSKAWHSFAGSLRLGALLCLVLAGLAATRLLLPALADTTGRPDVIWMRGGHTADVRSMDYSSDGQLVAAIGDEVGAVKIWRLSDGMLLRTLNVFGASAFQVKFLSDSQTIVVTGSESNAIFDQRIKRVRVSDGQTIWSQILSDNSASIHVTSGGKIFNIGNGFQIYNSADGASLRSSNQAFYRSSNGTPINFGRFGPVGVPAANGNIAGSILPDTSTYPY